MSRVVGSTIRICRAESLALRPYSRAVMWPICQGPSISLPRHQKRTPCGARQPRPRLVDAGVDRAAQVLQERPEQPPVEVGAIASALEHRPGGPHGLGVAEGAQPGAGRKGDTRTAQAGDELTAAREVLHEPILPARIT